MSLEIEWLDLRSPAIMWMVKVAQLHRLTASENDVDRPEVRRSTIEAGLSNFLTFSYPSIFLPRHIIVAVCFSAISLYHI